MASATSKEITGATACQMRGVRTANAPNAQTVACCSSEEDTIGETDNQVQAAIFGALAISFDSVA